ncbi:MAG: flagellin [Defluviitaleaceae bacterium]|nr:flagellin [Defluviitaleaceae bacterium]
MKIGYNPPSMEAYNALLKTGRGMQLSTARLSTGFKINKASQNAAGLAISNTLRTQAEGVEKASQNSSNAITLLQTAEGAMSEMHAILHRMRELTVQAANDTNEVPDREKMQKEIEQLKDELDSMSDRCEFNQMKLLRGNGQGGDMVLTFHTGANKGYNMTVRLPMLDSRSLGPLDDPVFFADSNGNPIYLLDAAGDPVYALDDDGDPIPLLDENGDPVFLLDHNGEEALDAGGNPIPVMTPASLPTSVRDIDVVGELRVDGNDRLILDVNGDPLPDSPDIARQRRNLALEIADAAIEQLSGIRARIGAYINRLEHTVTYLDAANNAARTSLSRIFDTDMAEEMSNYSKLQVLTQAATSIMAQANQVPQNVLQLLH